MKYKEWLYKWLENYIKPSSKEKTYTRYCEIVEQHIIPYMGECKLINLSIIGIQQFITYLIQCGNKKTNKGLPPNSVNSIISVIQNSLRTAFTLDYIKKYMADKKRLLVLPFRNKNKSNRRC